MYTAASELGLRPPELHRAVQLGEVRTVHGEVRGRRSVPCTELERVKGADDYPHGLRARLRVVGAAGGARLLGIATSRFHRLARGGCFRPVEFYVSRYRTVVWLYLTAELRAFAERRPELLRGTAPRGLRVLLKEGVDYRQWHWRGRRIGQLCRQAAGPWERAAARAAVLGEEVLASSVPDDGERARLRALRPTLLTTRQQSVVGEDAARELCVATAGDEILWHRLMLDADLEEARATEPGGPLAPRGAPEATTASPCAARGSGAPQLEPGLRGATVVPIGSAVPSRAGHRSEVLPESGQRRWRDRLLRRTVAECASVPRSEPV